MSVDTDYEQLLPRLRELSERLLEIASSTGANSELTVAAADLHVLGMYWRARRLFQAINVLLDAQMPEESAMLGRSLFETSLHLKQLAAEPENKEALILGWANQSLQEIEGLVKEAAAQGMEKDEAGALSKLDSRRKALQKYGRGVGRHSRFLTARDAAKRYGRLNDYWNYLWSHEAVHGSEASWAYSRRKSASGTLTFFAKNDDPAVLSGARAYAALSMTDAIQAVTTVFGWDPSSEVASIAEEIRTSALYVK